MKKSNRKSRLTLTALGVALSTAVAYTSAHAEYDTDYEISSVYDAAVNNIPYSSPASIRAGGYKSEILLDQAYHEYQTGEVDAFEAGLVDLEQTEMAAFEIAEPSILPSLVPWQVDGTLD